MSDQPFDPVHLSASYSARHDRREEKNLFERELVRVRERRETFGTAHNSVKSRRASTDDSIGICLSGGGIRSATISLGILRALCRAGLLPYVDYMSTVSGGTYTGAFLGSLFVPPEWRGDVETGANEKPLGGTGDPVQGPDAIQALSHLRQSGRHLMPGSAGDLMQLVVLATRSWFAVQIVLGMTLLPILMSLKLPQAFLLNARWARTLEADWVVSFGLTPGLWPSEWLRGFPLTPWFRASWLFLVAAIFLIATASLYLAYFLARGQSASGTSRVWRLITGPAIWVALPLGGGGLWMASYNHESPYRQLVSVGFAIVSMLAVMEYGVAEWLDAVRTAEQTPGVDTWFSVRAPSSPQVQESRVRYLLTRWAASTLMAACCFGALALFDSIAESIYMSGTSISFPLTWSAIVAAAVPAARQLLLRVPNLSKMGEKVSPYLKRFGSVLALIGGLSLALTIGVFWGVVAHVLAWWGQPVGDLKTWQMMIGDSWGTNAYPIAGIWLACTLLSVGIAISFSFLNLSTFTAFYASRLRRAYLGASNRRRWTETPPTPDNSDHIDDDIALDRYYAKGLLGPIHLINATINDTASKALNTTIRDRRGKPITVSPMGFHYPDDTNRGFLKTIPFYWDGSSPKLRSPEKLPLSTWVGISGAAASTGIGQYGSLGLSLLAGLANIRLGYWWDPGSGPQAEPPWRRTTQGRLLDELTGRFRGSDGSRWYLTDGGHFENTGAYELVRRRVALIIICDNGADPDYQFSDLLTLTRRIRIDFGAELTMIDDADKLDKLLGAGTKLRGAFGCMHEFSLAQVQDPRIGPYAALGEIRYQDSERPGLSMRPSSTVLLIKPRVCGREAADLVAYAKVHKPFPQQSTLDQFFDEAQWESYFLLGEIMGKCLFQAGADAPWMPWSKRS